MTMMTSSRGSRTASAKPKYTFCNQDSRWYFRHRLLGIARLRGAPGEPQFHRDYADKLAAVEAAKKQPPGLKKQKPTLAWLIDQYEHSPEFKSLKPRTREGYSGLLEQVVAKIGDLPYQSLERRHVVVLRNSYADTPRKADYTISALSAVFSWKIAQEDEELANPCKGVKKAQRKSTIEGYVPWTEDQIEYFFANCKEVFRVPVALGLFTGQRLSDCIPMKTKQLTGSTITIVTNKTGEFVEVSVHPDLAVVLSNRPYQDQPTFVVGIGGRPYSDPKSFSKQLTGEIRRLDLPRLTFHGLRYAACARLEDVGCSPYEVEDIVGHRTYEMAKKYMSKRRTREKVQRLQEKSATSSETPS